MAVALDLVHVVAMGTWVGGLVLFGVLALRRVADEDVGAIGAAFSRVATVAMVALTVTGLGQSYRQLGGLSAITSTTYGRLLVVKVLLVAGMVAAGATNRAAIRRADAGAAGGRDLRVRLGRGLGIEVGLVVGVLALTSLLVNTVPGREQVAAPFAQQMTSQDYTLSITIDPAGRTGNEVHLYFNGPGLGSPPPQVEDATLQLSDPEKGVTGVVVPLERGGPNHFLAYDLAFPFPGRWSLAVTARFGEFTSVPFDTAVQIR